MIIYPTLDETRERQIAAPPPEALTPPTPMPPPIPTKKDVKAEVIDDAMDASQWT